MTPWTTLSPAQGVGPGHPQTFLAGQQVHPTVRPCPRSRQGHGDRRGQVAGGTCSYGTQCRGCAAAGVRPLQGGVGPSGCQRVLCPHRSGGQVVQGERRVCLCSLNCRDVYEGLGVLGRPCWVARGGRQGENGPGHRGEEARLGPDPRLEALCFPSQPVQ